MMVEDFRTLLLDCKHSFSLEYHLSWSILIINFSALEMSATVKLGSSRCSCKTSIKMVAVARVSFIYVQLEYVSRKLSTLLVSVTTVALQLIESWISGSSSGTETWRRGFSEGSSFSHSI